MKHRCGAIVREKKGIRVVSFASLLRQTTGLLPETNWRTSTTRATKRRRWIYPKRFYLIVKCLYENNRLIIVMRSEQ